MQCPECQHKNPDAAKFCMECGTRLELTCSQCGVKLPPDAKFCMECGAKVKESTPAQHTPKAKAAIPKLEDMQDRLYIPEPLRNRMDTAQREMAGENRLVTSLFADISGFTPMSQTMDTEMVVEKLNQYFQATNDAIYRYEGSVNRVIGDGVLAFFGAPLAHENDPERAILAALDMREAASQLGLDISVGINTGIVYFGPVGSQEHLETSAYGIDVILAQRLSVAAQPGQILVGNNAYRFTRRAFEFQRLPPLTLKGIKKPETAYAVIRLLSRPEKIRGIEGLRADLIGREEELNKLKDALMEVVQGSGQMVSIIGEAGVGKSRLIAELREFTLSPPDGGLPLWLEGRCLSLGITASYWPFIEMFREHFGWSSQDDESSRAKHIRLSLQDMVDQGALPKGRLDEIDPFLGNLLSVRSGNDWDESFKDLAPEQIKSQTFIAVRDFLIALARRRPVVLVLEDLHWADSLSLDLISFLMETLTLTPLLLLCVYRPEKEHKCWHLATIASQKCLDRYTEIHLRELTLQQSRHLVESLLTIEDLPVSVKELILGKSQGNPFFVEEVVRSLMHTGMIYKDGDVWRAHGDIESVAVPETIQSIILSRVDHLEQELKYVLQSASVIGRLFRRRLLERVMQHEANLERDLWELEDNDLIYQERAIPEEEYSFRHVLTQETVYHNILTRRRAAFHQQVAEAMEEIYQGSLDEYYEQLAHHYDRSGNVEKALDYLFKAGDKAKRSYANDEAIAHFSRGLKLLKILQETPERDKRELDFHIQMGVALIAVKGHASPEVGATYSRARDLCERVGQTSQLFQALLGLRRFHFMRMELKTAHELGERLLSLAQEMGEPVHLSRAYVMLTETSTMLGQLSQTRTYAKQTVHFYDALGTEEQRSELLRYGTDPRLVGGYDAWALWLLGYPDQIAELSNKLLAQAREQGHPFNIALGFWLAAFLHYFRREAQTVQKLAEDMILVATERGFSMFLAIGNCLRGWAIAEQGRTGEGIAQIQQGLDAWRDTGATTFSLAAGLLADAYWKAGQAEKGLDILDEVLTAIDRTGERIWEAELHRLKGELLLMQGSDDVEAEACFQQAIDVARRQQARPLELRASMSLGRLWQKQGKKAQARELLREIYGWFTEGFDTIDLKEAKAMLDQLA